MGWVNWRSEKVEVNTQESSPEYRRRQILCRRLNIERGIVRMRVVIVPRSVEIKPFVLRSDLTKMGAPRNNNEMVEGY